MKRNQRRILNRNKRRYPMTEAEARAKAQDTRRRILLRKFTQFRRNSIARMKLDRDDEELRAYIMEHG